MRVSFLGKRLDLGTGFSLGNTEDWNAEEECVKKNVRLSAAVNEELRSCRDTMEIVFRYFEVNEAKPSVREVAQMYRTRMAGITPVKTGEPDFFSKFDEFTASCAINNAWSSSTKARMKTFRKELFQFN